MSDLQKIGPDWGGSGTFKPFTSSISGGQRVNDAHGRYLDAVIGNRVFYLSTAAAAPTAYVGAAGGTPLLAIHNPANSNKVLVALMVGIAIRAQATAGPNAGLALWSGPSVLPTGTQTTPTSVFSGAATGSSAKGFVNTAMTGSTALSLAMPLYTYGWASAAGLIIAPGLLDIGGIVIATPGNQIALGVTAVPTSTTVDVSMIWEEVPFLV
jgi:hypothetical protein